MVVTWVKQKTRNLRHKLLYMLAPQLYRAGKEHASGLPRPMIQFLKHYYGNRALVGVEIGVAEGKNAENILRELNIDKLFLVDPYQPYMQNGKLETRYIHDYSKALNRLHNYHGKVTFIKESSKQATGFIPDTLDFVYIDGDHSYPVVKHDIQTYYRKTRANGVVGGHNFDVTHLDGVVKAVMEFKRETRCQLQGYSSDWWIIKVDDVV